MEQFIWGVLGVMLVVGISYLLSEWEDKQKKK
jgi:hypothetical protein